MKSFLKTLSNFFIYLIDISIVQKKKWYTHKRMENNCYCIHLFFYIQHYTIVWIYYTQITFWARINNYIVADEANIKSKWQIRINSKTLIDNYSTQLFSKKNNFKVGQSIKIPFCIIQKNNEETANSTVQFLWQST